MSQFSFKADWVATMVYLVKGCSAPILAQDIAPMADLYVVSAAATQPKLRTLEA
jgi:hypothetical protein